LEQGENEAADARRADLGATIVKLGSSKYRLKLWNKGKAAARNVQINFPDDDDLVNRSELTAKFPFERLEQYQSVELIAAVYMGMKRKYELTLIWADDFSEKNEKTIYLTL